MNEFEEDELEMFFASNNSSDKSGQAVGCRMGNFFIIIINFIPNRTEDYVDGVVYGSSRILG